MAVVEIVPLNVESLLLTCLAMFDCSLFSLRAKCLRLAI